MTNSNWTYHVGGDGFVTAQDPTDPNIAYGESQGGNIVRFNIATNESFFLQKPNWGPRYRQYEDSLVTMRGDTSMPVTRELQRRIDTLRVRQKADSSDLALRWNWNTPFFLSPHNPSVMYAGSNRVMRSLQRGENMYAISPDLSKKLMAKIDTSIRKTGGITLDATSAETYGTIVSLAESYIRPGFLYAGTDDGNVWMTRNDGGTWEQIPAAKFAGLPAEGAYVSEIEPSHFDSLTFYITFDNHRVGDFKPYVYGTEDGGRTFRAMANNLPNDGPDFAHVIKEDTRNRDLLFVGTSVGVYASLDRGATWTKFMTGLPTVPVYDLKIHPRDNELIAATHGRSFWVVDITPLQQMTRSAIASVVTNAPYLFTPKTALQYTTRAAAAGVTNGYGHQLFTIPSPQYGAEIVYRVGSAPRTQPTGTGPPNDAANRQTMVAATIGGGGAVAIQGPGGAQPNPNQARIIVLNAANDTMATLTGPTSAGVHRVTWGLFPRFTPTPLSPSQKRDSVLRVRRVEFVFDSLSKAQVGADTVLNQIKRMILTNNLGPLFQQGPPGPGGAVNPNRPGEGPLVRPRAPSTTPSPTEAPADLVNRVFTGGFFQMQQLMNPPGVVQAPGFFGGGFSEVPPGDYRVELILGDTKLSKTLRVERPR
jgi:hypothetical protein